MHVYRYTYIYPMTYLSRSVRATFAAFLDALLLAALTRSLSAYLSFVGVPFVRIGLSLTEEIPLPATESAEPPLSAYVYKYIYICMYKYIYIYLYVFIYIYVTIHILIYMYLYMYTYLQFYLYHLCSL
jgi:hypothetical protein